MSKDGMSTELTRREALEKVKYVAPLILTLAVMPSFASAGSGGHKKHRKHGKHSREGED
jgi:hypothetical protein